MQLTFGTLVDHSSTRRLIGVRVFVFGYQPWMFMLTCPSFSAASSCIIFVFPRPTAQIMASVLFSFMLICSPCAWKVCMVSSAAVVSAGKVVGIHHGNGNGFSWRSQGYDQAD